MKQFHRVRSNIIEFVHLNAEICTRGHHQVMTVLSMFNVLICSSTRGPPLWSSSQSSWLQIPRPGFDSRHYEKKVVGLERGLLSLVSTTEELLDRKVAAPA
jgi:hypothetical protein